MTRYLTLLILFLTLNSTTVMAATIQLPATGQTGSYATGDDGDQPRGAAWPDPRFTDNINGTVTDNLTGLVWLKDANCEALIGGVSTIDTQGFWALPVIWQDALIWSNSLMTGYCGLTDNSKAGDWRLPNRKELMSLTDISQNFPALPVGHPFTNVNYDYGFWSSSTHTTFPDSAWYVSMSGGDWNGGSYKLNYNYVWPVRAGQ